jgi:hypothetical protein
MDWSTHFQALSRGHSPTASFGTTLFGKYTIAELQSLINGKDDEVANFAKYTSKASPAWQSDFKALQSDYTQARTAGVNAIAGQKYSIFADNLNPEGDSYYKAILSVFNPRWQQHDGATDRAVSLMNRLNAEGIKVAPYTVRQPGPKDDAMNYAQQHPVDYFITSPAQQLIQGAGDIAKPVLDWTRPIVIAIAALATVMGFFLIKSYLPTPRSNLGTLGAPRP